jgi:hypothetical protein
MNTPHVPKVRVRAARTAGQLQQSEPIGDTSNSHRATLTLKANAVARNLVRHVAPQPTSGAPASKNSLPERARWSSANGR